MIQQIRLILPENSGYFVSKHNFYRRRKLRFVFFHVWKYIETTYDCYLSRFDKKKFTYVPAIMVSLFW